MSKVDLIKELIVQLHSSNSRTRDAAKEQLLELRNEKEKIVKHGDVVVAAVFLSASEMHTKLIGSEILASGHCDWRLISAHKSFFEEQVRTLLRSSFVDKKGKDSKERLKNLLRKIKAEIPTAVKSLISLHEKKQYLEVEQRLKTLSSSDKRMFKEIIRQRREERRSRTPPPCLVPSTPPAPPAEIISPRSQPPPIPGTIPRTEIPKLNLSSATGSSAAVSGEKVHEQAVMERDVQKYGEAAIGESNSVSDSSHSDVASNSCSHSDVASNSRSHIDASDAAEAGDEDVRAPKMRKMIVVGELGKLEKGQGGGDAKEDALRRLRRELIEIDNEIALKERKQWFIDLSPRSDADEEDDDFSDSSEDWDAGWSDESRDSGDDEAIDLDDVWWHAIKKSTVSAESRLAALTNRLKQLKIHLMVAVGEAGAAKDRARTRQKRFRNLLSRNMQPTPRGSRAQQRVALLAKRIEALERKYVEEGEALVASAEASVVPEADEHVEAMFDDDISSNQREAVDEQMGAQSFPTKRQALICTAVYIDFFDYYEEFVDALHCSKNLMDSLASAQNAEWNDLVDLFARCSFSSLANSNFVLLESFRQLKNDANLSVGTLLMKILRTFALYFDAAAAENYASLIDTFDKLWRSSREWRT